MRAAVLLWHRCPPHFTPNEFGRHSRQNKLFCAYRNGETSAIITHKVIVDAKVECSR